MAVILEGNVSIFFIGQEASRLMRDSSIDENEKNHAKLLQREVLQTGHKGKG